MPLCAGSALLFVMSCAAHGSSHRFVLRLRSSARHEQPGTRYLPIWHIMSRCTRAVSMPIRHWPGRARASSLSGTARRPVTSWLACPEGGVELVVDVRSVPGSRRFPQFRRAELEVWLPAAGIRYRWEPGLGGLRRPAAASPNVALRHPSFRSYADYTTAECFGQTLARVVGEASRQVTAAAVHVVGAQGSCNAAAAG